MTFGPDVDGRGNGCERRRVAPLPVPGERALVDEATREREAKRRARNEAAETLQRANWRWFGPRYDPDAGVWSKAHRIGTCGRPMGTAVPVSVAAVGDDGSPLSVEFEATGSARRAQFSDVETCGNPNACLKCGAKIRGKRAADIGRLLRAHLAGGGHALFVTLTFSHEASESAADVIDDAALAWSRLVKSRRYRTLKATAGVTGLVRVTEVNHGDHGWHPHHHIALLCDRPLEANDFDGGDLEAFRLELDQVWRHQVSKLDRNVHPVIGVTVFPIRDDQGVGAYVSKIELELVRSDLKTGRTTGSRSHWQVGIDAATNGDPRDVALWHEFVAATIAGGEDKRPRRRYLAPTPGLWARYGIVEESDDDIAAQRLDAAPLVDIDREIYTAAARHHAPLLSEVRALAESGATPEVIAAVLGRRLGLALEAMDLGPDLVPVIRAQPTTGHRPGQPNQEAT